MAKNPDIVMEPITLKTPGSMSVATRVVGGDYKTEIQVGSEDEVGQLEQLFEQFRRVFVDLLVHMPELQER